MRPDPPAIPPGENANSSPVPERSPAASLEQFQKEHRATEAGVRDGVYVIPEEARNDGDDKPERRHWVAVLPSGVRNGTAVYGTKSPEAAKRDAPHRRISPRPGPHGNGLLVPTYFYPTVVTYLQPQDLHDPRGVLTNAESDPLRREMKRAFGIGERRCGDAGVDPETWRGKIVRVPWMIEEAHEFRYGFVLTCHAHSVQRYDQLVVPLFISDSEADDPEHDVVSLDPHARLLLNTSDPVVWAVPAMLSIHQKRQFLLDTGKIISADDLRRVEEVLVSRFGL